MVANVTSPADRQIVPGPLLGWLRAPRFSVRLRSWAGDMGLLENLLASPLS